MNSFVTDFGRPREPDKVFSHPATAESRFLFHCYINEVDQLDKPKTSHKATSVDADELFQEGSRSSGRPEEDLTQMSKFNIPNFVNTDPNSSFGEDDLLISEPPIVLENKPIAQTSHEVLD
ncbi:melanocortin-2 receptor accessory protein 2 isoform X2 [Notamacropus eugenii]